MRTHRLATLPEPGPAGRSGRRYVARRGVDGVRVFVHHPYGRVARLVPAAGKPPAADPPGTAGVFPGPAEAAEAIARDVLHRPPDPGTRDDLTRMLAGPEPRVELEERAVRVLAGRAAAR